ncbi:MAG TPA: LysR family transcriptional regulator [Candidatus Barnesiella excrementigallinarum]|nr:LysR family transcriptional regulator [Candidatus Barnesiella excrementigallinarum]
MIDFRLKVFCSVAHNLSFTKASKELYVSQPAISKHIQELETEYSTRLFERMGTHITLTPEGELLLSHAEKILKQYKQLDFEMNLLSQQHIGELRLGASTTIAQYVLPAYLATFQQKFKQIKLSLINGNTRDIEKALEEHRIDLGLIEGCSRQNYLHYTPFMRDELVCITSTRSRLAQYDEITVDELRKLPLVIRESGSGSLEVLEKALALHQLKLAQLNIIMQMGTTEGIKRFLYNTDSVGVVSIQAVSSDIAEGRLKVIDISDFNCEREFCFVQNAGQTGGVESDFMRYIMRKY